MGSNNTLEVSVVIGAESPCVINALNMEYKYDLNSLKNKTVRELIEDVKTTYQKKLKTDEMKKELAFLQHHQDDVKNFNWDYMKMRWPYYSGKKPNKHELAWLPSDLEKLKAKSVYDLLVSNLKDTKIEKAVASGEPGWRELWVARDNIYPKLIFTVYKDLEAKEYAKPNKPSK